MQHGRFRGDLGTLDHGPTDPELIDWLERDATVFAPNPGTENRRYARLRKVHRQDAGATGKRK